MVNKIIFSGIFVCLCIAIPLAMLGYEKVELGPPFLALMRSINNDFAEFTIAIPEIPLIPRFDNAEGFQLILNAFIQFVNMFVWIINAISSVLNIVLQLIQFLVLLVKNLVTFKDVIGDYNPIV